MVDVMKLGDFCRAKWFENKQIGKMVILRSDTKRSWVYRCAGARGCSKSPTSAERSVDDD